MAAEAGAVAALRDGNACASRGDWRDAFACYSGGMRRAEDAPAAAWGPARAALLLARSTAGVRLRRLAEAVADAEQGSTEQALAALSAAEAAEADAAREGAPAAETFAAALAPTAADPAEAGLPLAAVARYRLGHARRAAGDGRGARAAFGACAAAAVGHSGAQRAKRAAELGPCFEAAHLVEAREVKGKGIGTIAVADIAPGTLLLEEQPFATARGDKDDTALVLNHLLETVHKRMLREPDAAELVRALFPSREQSEREFEHHHINPEDEDAAPYPPELIADLNHLWNILTCNTFRIDAGAGLWDSPEEICSGMFLRASRLNHSCQPSCHYCFKGGTIQIRAVRPIRAGEEATIAYVNVYSRPEWRLQKLKAGYHFECADCVDRSRREADISLDALVCTSEGCAGYLTSDRHGVYRCVGCSTVREQSWGDEMRAHLSRLRNKPGMEDKLALVDAWRAKAHPRHAGLFAAYTEAVHQCVRGAEEQPQQAAVGLRMAKRGLACLQGLGVEHAAAVPLWVRAAMLSAVPLERRALLRRAQQLSAQLYGPEDDFYKRFGVAR
eukprot:TRINITY_DN11634_c2_g1_i1.p2 TRINITY_DN11634_c2_g1~~TRINITY_DN11634_c2_g1_i1.p2  ORF type:complete len:585 (+),score=222.86 TRINITY_DN11634_c2_g1_i1:80-1756(+)